MGNKKNMSMKVYSVIITLFLLSVLINCSNLKKDNKNSTNITPTHKLKPSKAHSKNAKKDLELKEKDDEKIEKEEKEEKEEKIEKEEKEKKEVEEKVFKEEVKNATKKAEKNFTKADYANAEKNYGELTKNTTQLFNNLQVLFKEAKEKLNEKNHLTEDEEEKIMQNIGSQFQKIGEKANNMTQIFEKIKEDGLIKQKKINLLAKKFTKLQNLAGEIRKSGDNQMQDMAEKKEEKFMQKVTEIYENYKKTNSVIEHMEEGFGQMKSIEKAEIIKKFGNLKNNLEKIEKANKETGTAIWEQIQKWGYFSEKKLQELEGIRIKMVGFVKENNK